jgi:hypothetical protein
VLVSQLVDVADLRRPGELTDPDPGEDEDGDEGVADIKCVTSEPQGVGAEQRGQKAADSGMSAAQVGQLGMCVGQARVSRGAGLAAM